MPLIIATLTDYSYEYIESWANENGISIEKAINEIISSVRNDAEEAEHKE